MSEGVRSNQPALLKRRRAEDLDSGGSVGQPCCRYKRCTSGRTWSPREFCSKSHRDYFNAELFDLVINGIAQVTEEPGKCKLVGCELPVWESFDFCRAGHAVKYREDETEKWDLGNRLCKLQSCSHHVHVDERSKEVSEYCCREHQFDAAAARGKQAAAAKRKLKAAARTDGGKDPVSSDESRQISISQEAPQQLLQAKFKNERGYHDKVPGDKTMENCLRHLLMKPGDFSTADPSANFCLVESLDFHPFHDITEFEGFKPRYYLHLIDAEKGRERSTKEGFGWKQKGREHKNKGTYKPLNTTYFTYELKPSSKADSRDDHCGYVVAYREYEEAREAKTLEKGTETRWKMSQYFLPDNIVMEVTGGHLPSKIPVISKIYQDKNGRPVWPPLPQKEETRAREVNNTSVSAGTIPAAPCHERGMTSSICSNASPPGENLSPGREILLNAYSHEFDVYESFLEDSLAKRSLMEVIADESEILPSLKCDSSSPPNEGLHPTNYDYSFAEDPLDQSKLGGDWDVDGNLWLLMDATMSLPDQLGPC